MGYRRPGELPTNGSPSRVPSSPTSRPAALATAFRRWRLPLAVLCLALVAPAAAQESRKPPAYSIRRVASQRPAMAGAFDSSGDRFVFVHGDRLWLSEGGAVRRIGFPAVDHVYRACWVSETRILVSHVIPGEGDALGILDLAAGRFRPLARGVHEDHFAVSRRGGLVVWREASGAGTGRVRMAQAAGDAPGSVRLGGAESATLAVPAPGGERVAGLAYGGKPCLHLAPSGGAVALTAEPDETVVAAAWAPDGGKVAYLLASAPAGAQLAPQAAANAATPPATPRQVLAVYSVGETSPALRLALPQPCADIAWDAEGAGIFCRAEGPDPGVWHLGCAPSAQPRCIYRGSVRQLAPVAGGRALAVLPAPEKPGLSRLFLLDAAGAAPVRIANTPSFDHLDDLSSDFRRVLITRRPKDDRQSLFPEATLWVFELR